MSPKSIEAYRWKLPAGKLVVGLTGAIAAGKTAAAERFRALGAEVICADSLAAEQFEKGRAAYRAVVRRYGKSALDEKGNMNRAFLAGRVFSSSADRKWLEGVIHPPVLKQAGAMIKASKKKIVVFDVPLLFEKGMGSWFDLTAAVFSGRKSRLSRIKARGWTQAELVKRSRAQMTGSKKAAMSDVVIDNSGTIAMLHKQIDGIYNALRKLAKEPKRNAKPCK